MIKEFKEFALKGNVVDMGVGIIIGTAFGAIVNSFVADIIMPPLGWLLGGIDLSNLSIMLNHNDGIALNYGMFINTIIDFLIIAFAMFIVVKQINRLRKKEEKKAKEPGEQILLLREIRDELKK